MAHALLASPAIAQTREQGNKGNALEGVVGIGSRVAGRTVTETSVPVDVFDSKTLATRLRYKARTGFGLNYDVSASFGQNSIEEHSVSNTMNPSMGPDSPTKLPGLQHVIFNNYPDKNMRAMSLNGPAPTPTQNWYAFTGATIAGNRYPSAAPIGINGAFWYARFNLEF